MAESDRAEDRVCFPEYGIIYKLRAVLPAKKYQGKVCPENGMNRHNLR